MSSLHPADLPEWSRTRLNLLIAALFVGQLGLLFLLGAAPGRIRDRTMDPFQIRVMEPNAGSVHLADAVAPDPTVFVLPGPRGFSALAWLRVEDPDPGLEHRAESDFWLLPRSQDLGLGITREKSRSAESVGLLEKPVAQAGSIELLLAPSAVANQSWARLEGDISQRRPKSFPDLPSWTHADLLNNSAVEVMVDPLGDVYSARLVQKSGSPAADRYALQAAARLLFRPASGASALTSGRVNFLWHTLPVGSSNAPPRGF